jgi:hypothetical protein
LKLRAPGISIILPFSQSTDCQLFHFHRALSTVTACWFAGDGLTDAEKASVEQDPKLQSAIQWQVELEDRCAQSNDPTLWALLEQQKHDIDSTHRGLQEKRQKEIRQDFSRKQAVIDIARQLTGGGVTHEPAREVLRKEFTITPEQIRLVKPIFTQPTSDLLDVGL